MQTNIIFIKYFDSLQKIRLQNNNQLNISILAKCIKNLTLTQKIRNRNKLSKCSMLVSQACDQKLLQLVINFEFPFIGRMIKMKINGKTATLKSLRPLLADRFGVDMSHIRLKFYLKSEKKQTLDQELPLGQIQVFTKGAPEYKVRMNKAPKRQTKNKQKLQPKQSNQLIQCIFQISNPFLINTQQQICKYSHNQPLNRQMFSTLRNHSKHLTSSQRFYYDNYDYYNIYQNLQADYKDDLSKFIYRCNRRSTPIIVTYYSTLRYKHSRHIRPEPSLSPYPQSSMQQQQLSAKTMQQFLHTYINIYIQNNYSHPSRIYEKSPIQQYNLVYISPVSNSKYENSTQKLYLLRTEDLSLCIQRIMQAINGRIQGLNEEYEGCQQGMGDGEDSHTDSRRRLGDVQLHFALELYGLRVLIEMYKIQDGNAEEEGKEGFRLLYQWVVELHRFMWQLMDSRMRTILLLAQPKTYHLNLIIHPLSLPITTFLKYKHQAIPIQSQFQHPQWYKLVSQSSNKNQSNSQNQNMKQNDNQNENDNANGNGNGSENYSMPNPHKPKIVFLNLDGRESIHNLRTIATLGDQNLLYISIYEQPSWLERRETQMNNIFNSEDEGFQATYSKFWQLNSQSIIYQLNQSQSSSSKMLLFPLNSIHILKRNLSSVFSCNSCCSPPCSPNCSSCPSPLLTLLSSPFPTPQLIHSLFQHIIYQKIRIFQPTMIFISYNGQLDIMEEYFTDLVRNCAIMADHRVVLFGNFVHFFQDESYQVYEDLEEHASKLLAAHQFYQRAMMYRFGGVGNNSINQERLWANISNFIKYSSGQYSMQDNTMGRPDMKFLMPKFYSYLQSLSCLPEFSFVQPHLMHKFSPNELSSLFSSYKKLQIKQTRKQNKYYQLLNGIVQEFLIKKISQKHLENILGKRLYYRYRFIVQELKKENELLGERAIEDGKLIEEYFEGQKERLLVQNLQNYKIKKYFYLGQNQKSFGQVSCFKFLLQSSTKQTQQLLLQKYSQIIINNEDEQLFLLNYKAPDNRHLLLHGSIRNTQLQRQILMSQIEQTDIQKNKSIEKQLEKLFITEEGGAYTRGDIVFVQYNYCFYAKNLYLYWPIMWNLKEEARCKMLGVQYKAKRVWVMIRVFADNSEFRYRFENLVYQPPEDGIETIPRWGCSAKFVEDNCFYVFGGIFDNQNDFKMIGRGISQGEIRDHGNYKSFTINSLPKSYQSYVLPCLKPKINYLIRQNQQKNEQNCYKIRNGYGRDNTGFFNPFCYQQYDFEVRKDLDPRNFFKKCNISQGKFIRRFVQTQKPIQCDKMGKFNVIINNYNTSQTEQKFSDSLKDKFIFQKKIVQNSSSNLNTNSNSNSNMNIASTSIKNSEWELMVFIDETYRVSEFKTDPKKLFLYGFDRTVRQKIYLRCWSPQLYIVDGIKQYIVNLSLKTQKTSSYVITNYLMPRQQDIVSLCLQEDRLYLLSNSPIIHSIDRAGLKFVLYEGSLTNMSQIIHKRQIQMITMHNFDQQYERFLEEKTIFVDDQKIYLVGGLGIFDSSTINSRYERQDYVLETNKNKFKIKTRKIQSQQSNLDMPNSVIVKQAQSFYIYSIKYEDQPSPQQQSLKIEWKVKIQHHSYQPNTQQKSTLRTGPFRTYIHPSPLSPSLSQSSSTSSSTSTFQPSWPLCYSHANIDQPKFVRIVKYKRFQYSTVREVIAKIMWKIDKSGHMDEGKFAVFQPIRKFHFQVNDQILGKMLENQWKGYEDMLTAVKNKTQLGIQVNFEQQQLLKDLKHLYELVTKMILQRHLQLSTPSPNEHLFIAQDSSSKKVKYLSIGPLGTTKLNFIRIRFKHELSINLNQYNQHGDEALFYHPTMAGYYRFEYEGRDGQGMGQGMGKGGKEGMTGQMQNWGGDQNEIAVFIGVKQ